MMITTRYSAILFAGMLLAVGWGGDRNAAQAQSSSLPGLVVTIPPSNPAPPQSEPAKPKPQTEGWQATPKPAKPQVARRPPARANSGSGSGSKGAVEHKIKLLVNDAPITNYEINARARLLAMRTNIGDQAKKAFQRLIRNPSTNKELRAIFEKTVRENRGKTREQVLAIFEKRKQAFGAKLQRRAMNSARNSVLPGLRKRAETELIEDRLKIQAAESLSITVDPKRGDEIFNDLAKRNKLTPKQFEEQIRRSGAEPLAMKEKLQADAAWNMAVRRKFRAVVSVNQREVDEFLGAQTNTGNQKLGLHKITFPVPQSLDQRSMTEVFQRAESLRSGFKGCTSTQGLAGNARGAKFQDLGSVDSNKIAEPTRSMLLAANANEMLPPTVIRQEIVLYAVCSKSTSQEALKRKEVARRQLQSQEFEMLARRYLADLKRDAHIDRR